MLKHKTLAYSKDGVRRPVCKQGLFFTELRKEEGRKAGATNNV
jgi:hypothetical protein